MKQTRFCGGPSVGLRDWLPPQSPSSDLAGLWPQLRDRQVIGTHRGRSAVALACRLLAIGPGHEVLVPAYNCGTEIDALLHSGAQLVGYRVSRRCEIDLADLMARRSSRTRAVYLIHYFGWEQPMVELRRWCDDEGLLLVEDCALALFSSGSSGAIGRTGDAAIFSLPKTLGCCYGGLLTLPLSRTVEKPRLAPAGFRPLWQELRHSAQAAILGGLDLLGLYGVVHSARLRLRGNPHLPAADEDLPKMPAGYYFHPEKDADRALHPRAYAAAGSISCGEIVRRRRGNYLWLAGALASVPGVERLFARLPEGVCPLSFPLLSANRDACVAALQARGIGAFPWWAGFHRNGINWSQFPDACWLKRHLLTLPVHQRLDARHLHYVAETAVQVLQTVSTSGRGRWPVAGSLLARPRIN